MKKKILYFFLFIILIPITFNIYSIGKLLLTNITVTKAYFTPFYYIKKDSLSKEKTLIKYMEDNGWVFQDRFGAILIFEKNDEIKRFNINKLISMF